MAREAFDVPWVFVRLQRQYFGFSTADVREMLSVPEVCGAPDLPAHVRGMITLRDRVLPLIDLRARLGMTPVAQETEELCKFIELRAEDHRRWVRELEASIRESRPFTLALDPHKCAFGKWYDVMKTDNTVLAGQLHRIDQPHQQVHRKGVQALELARTQGAETALARVREIEAGDVATVCALMDETQDLLRKSAREIALVVEMAGRQFAITVDHVECVERIDPDRVDALPDHAATADIVSAIARRTRDDSIVMLLDAGRL